MKAADPIYSFEDPVAYLRFRHEERSLLDPRHSLRAWARSLGYPNPSYLAHVLRGERRLTPEFAAKLAESLALPRKVRRYFELLTLRALARSPLERAALHRRLRELRPRKLAPRPAADQHWRLLTADWAHMALLALARQSLAPPTEEECARRLGHLLGRRALRAAFRRLRELGALSNPSAFPNSRPAPLRLQRQWADLGAVIQRASPAPPGVFLGACVSLSSESVEAAQNILAEAHERIARLEGSGGQELFQVNLHLFQLTQEHSANLPRPRAERSPIRHARTVPRPGPGPRERADGQRGESAHDPDDPPPQADEKPISAHHRELEVVDP